jgi:Ni/Fe-hydrogenase subunit HybB-like protein
VYTAYLFAQARARDLWQSPLLPPHMLLQSVMLGMAVYVLAGAGQARYALVVITILHLLLVLGEMTVGHPTAHAQAAAHEMTHGRFAIYFWSGIGLALVALTAPWLGPIAAMAALAAVLAHEHAYVQAGQWVPLA